MYAACGHQNKKSEGQYGIYFRTDRYGRICIFRLYGGQFKENGYFWNGTLKAWYKKIKKEDQIKEQNYLNSLNLTDIQFADGNKIILKN